MVDWPKARTNVATTIITTLVLVAGGWIGSTVLSMTASQMAWGAFVGGGIVALWVFHWAFLRFARFVRVNELNDVLIPIEARLHALDGQSPLRRVAPTASVPFRQP